MLVQVCLCKQCVASCCGCLQIPPKLVHSEWTRGARLACTVCGQPGATVCCKGIREVGRRVLEDPAWLAWSRLP